MKVHINKPGSKKTIERVEIDPWDSWNTDVTLAHIIVPLLTQMKNDDIAASSVDFNDCPKELWPSPEEEKLIEKGEADEHYFKRWEWVLDEMIFAFQSKLEDWEDQFYTGEADYQFVSTGETDPTTGKEEKLSKMTKGPKHTLEFDEEGYLVYSERIQRGFTFFGKYYNGLWT